MRFVLLTLFSFLVVAPSIATGQDVFQEGRTALHEGRFEEARAILRPLLDEGNEHVHAPLYYETYRVEGGHADAMRDLETRLARTPSDPYLLHVYARLLLDTGRFDEAEDRLRQALRLESYQWHNALELAVLLEKTGRVGQARNLYEAVFERYEQGRFRTAQELLLGARAAVRLDNFHEANNAFRTAYRVDPRDVEVLYHWAELFREKYNETDARRTYQDALGVTAHRPEIYVGLARSGAGFARQEELARRALEINPRHVDALNLLAELHILDGQLDEAVARLEEARSVNPSSERTLANLASVHHLRGETESVRELEEQALAINPRSGLFFMVLAENAARRFRYPDAAVFARRAVDVDRNNPQAFALLGTSLLRLGRVQEARRFLQIGFEADPFNLFAGNTLTLLDDLTNFEVLESPNFRLVIHQSERDVLGPIVLDMAETAFDSLQARYPYRPPDKILLEAYNDADDFAVRVAGVPHVGLLGVSFGDVLAIVTPRAQPGASYNWARTLWHEIAHTMAIGVSDFRVPRWLTEGLSVYEEQRARPEWARKMDLEFFGAMDQGRLLPLVDIDRGFTRPSFPGQVMLSYYHASKVIAFVVDRHGFDGVIRVLEVLKTGLDVDAAFRAAVGSGLAELDRDFRAALRQERAALSAVLSGMPDLQGEAADLESEAGPVVRPDNAFFRLLQEGNMLLAQEDYDAAETRFLRAVDLYPDFVGEGDAYRGLAHVYRTQGREDRLAEVLESFLRRAEFGAAEARELGTLYAEAGRPDDAVHYLERSLEVDPYETAVREMLATLYEEQERHEKAVRHRRALVGLNPVDGAGAYYALALTLYRSRMHAEARRTVLQALELAPGFRDAQRLLLLVVEASTVEEPVP